jgi:hypothetical protein
MPKTIAPKPNEPQRQALAAIARGAEAARQLGSFMTPAGILADGAGDGIDLDPFLFPVEDIAKRHFGGGIDLERAISETFKLSAGDERLGYLHGLCLDETLAEVMAAFALGVAWGRLQARSKLVREGH